MASQMYHQNQVPTFSPFLMMTLCVHEKTPPAENMLYVLPLRRQVIENIEKYVFSPCKKYII